MPATRHIPTDNKSEGRNYVLVADQQPCVVVAKDRLHLLLATITSYVTHLSLSLLLLLDSGVKMVIRDEDKAHHANLSNGIFYYYYNIVDTT